MTREQILQWLIVLGEGWVSNLRADAITTPPQRIWARGDGWLLYRPRATDEYKLSRKAIKFLEEYKNDSA